MAHVGQVRYFGVTTIGGKEILAEIVGAEAEEVEFRRKLIKDERHGRNLDHSSYRHGAVEGDLFLFQLSLHLRDLVFEPENLFQSGNHGRHEMNTTQR